MSRWFVGPHTGLLVAALGVLAWASGQPFVFPSVGPSAFILAIEGRGEAASPRRVVGGHAIGSVAGFVSYVLLAGGAAVIAMPAAGSVAGAGLAASAALSVALTGTGMVLTGTEHAPACATTLIVSLGLLSTPENVALIVGSVVALVGVHRGVLVAEGEWN